MIWDSKVKEILLSTNSGQIGVLPNHAPIATAVDIGLSFDKTAKRPMVNGGSYGRFR